MKIVFNNLSELDKFISKYNNSPKRNSNYGEAAIIKPHTGDYVYTDGTFSAELDKNKELKGVALWVTDGRMITLWPDVPDKEMTYEDAEKWCQENGRKLLDYAAMLAVYINRDKLKNKIKLKDDCQYWVDYEKIDEDGYKWHRELYISPVFQGCIYYYDLVYGTAYFACR